MRISHELRTPLTAIQGHVQAIADGMIDGEEEQQASLEIVLAEAGRLQRLIGDLLDLARLETRRFSLKSRRSTSRPSASARIGAQREEAAVARSICTRVPTRAPSCSATATASCRSSRISSRTTCMHASRRRRRRRRVARRRRRARRRSDTGPGVPESDRESILRPS